MISSIDAEKAFDKIQYPFMIKDCQQSRHRGNIPQHNKAIYDKPTHSIIVNSEKLKAFPLRSGKDKDVHTHDFYSNSIGSSSHSNQTKKGNKRYPN